jgi:4-amino-4-deoxy-L-arabinose transferase-like glycosyltransferase
MILLIGVAFYGLHFLRLKADFPNYSPWNDWSKMTDEGWYGSAAIQHFLMGSWFLPDSFNPAVAVPVWPLILSMWFGITGVGMVSARVLTLLLYGVSLVFLFLLMRDRSSWHSALTIVPGLAVLLMTVNPFCYAFDRLAVLEPVMVLWLVLGLWLAGRTRATDMGSQVGLGIILFLLVLTKTTGFFLIPALLYQLSATIGWTRRAWMRPVAISAFTALILWLTYFALLVRPHYLADYRLLFTINQDRVHLSIVPQVALQTVWDGMWINRVLFPTAFIILLLSVVWLRELWHQPLFGSSVIATVAYLSFICYHSNLQPRYYLVVTMPVVIILLFGLESLWKQRRVLRGLVAAAIAFAIVTMAAQTIRYVISPEYSFANAADAIASRLRADPGSKQTLLSSSGANISLFTGIESLSPEYHTHGLQAVLDRYKPNWYAGWIGSDDDRITALRLRYRLEEKARYTVFDDPRRQTLVLYRMEPR